MTVNRYYKKFDIKEGKYFQTPNWIKKNFDDIPGKEIIIQSGDRLDIIAQQVYGDANLWKAIALYNDIGYFWELLPGDSLFLPLDIKKVLDRI